MIDNRNMGKRENCFKISLYNYEEACLLRDTMIPQMYRCVIIRNSESLSKYSNSIDQCVCYISQLLM